MFIVLFALLLYHNSITFASAKIFTNVGDYMIFYFSATGNCKYTADKIAKKTNDRIISISDYIGKSAEFSVSENENIGFVSPTYNWNLPSVVSDFLNNIVIENYSGNYVYFISTYGTITGVSSNLAKEILNNKGININAVYSVKMPDTWTPVFNLSDSKNVQKILDNSDNEIEKIIEKISLKTNGDFCKDKVPSIVEKTAAHTIFLNNNKTDKFTVSDACIGCSLCAKKCPVNAIEIVNGKPKWVKSECLTCLSCLHHCPKFAIQYGKNTAKHGQYDRKLYK